MYQYERLLSDWREGEVHLFSPLLEMVCVLQVVRLFLGKVVNLQLTALLIVDINNIMSIKIFT